MPKHENRKFNSPYNHTRGTTLDCSRDPSMTDQSQEPDCNINVIMDRYLKKGFELPPSLLAKGVAKYDDFSDSVDYHQAMNVITKSTEAFQAMPATIRERFKNDPALFLDFVHDENNLEEAHDLGLLNDEGKQKVRERRAGAHKTEAPK